MSLVENLFKNYGDFVVDIPHWEISDSGITALWGPSGSGKTTVFRLLIGLDPAPGLKWTFQGINLAALPVAERRFGVVFQTLDLFLHLTAKENILFAARARRIQLTESQQDLQQLTEMLGLGRVLDVDAKHLSLGERQRVALARAVIGRPRFLFLDEPFSSLDAANKKDARQLVNDVIERLGIPTLLVSHDPEDLAAARRVVRISGGRIVNEFPVSSI